MVIGLVTNNVINVVVVDIGEDLVQGVLLGVSNIAGHEEALVSVSLDEGVDDFTIGVDGSDNDSTMFILQFLGGISRLGTSRDGLVVDGHTVINSESDILDTITVERLMGVHFLLGVLVVTVGGTESQHDTLFVLDDVGGKFSVASFQTLVGEVFETETRGVPASSLLSVTHPEV